MSAQNLIITEKPSVAASIAAVLDAKERGDGFFMGSGHIVSWCYGHLVELSPPDAYGDTYSKWRYADLPIIPETWLREAVKSKARQLETLVTLLNRADVDTVINVCDAGREGELIFRLVYEYADCDKPVKRLWISSMEDAAIRAGFGNLKDGADYDNLYAAALCRTKADWLVGYNATRLFSTLYGATMGVGRVQSPTLALLTERETAITAFVKEPFYMPMIDIGTLTFSGERTKDRDAAEAVRAACDGQCATIHAVKNQTKTAAPPKLYDLTTLQREANRLLGFTARQTLDYAQSLYEKKLITYPRTDSRYLTSDMAEGLPALVSRAALMRMMTLDQDEINAAQVISDAKVTDHHAIIPTVGVSTADLSALPSGELDVLNMIVNRLVCAVMPTHTYEAVTAMLDCNGHTFTAKGKVTLDYGWKEIDNAFRVTLKADTDEDGDDAILPELDEGQTFDSVTAHVKEGFTSPPKRFTEDTLLSAMENAGAEDMPDDAERRGLGTPATRASIIEKLVRSGVVERQKKALVPTDRGKNLIAVLPDVLTSSALTAEWENKLEQIKRGELIAATFMDGIAAMTRDLVRENSTPKPEYAALFAADRHRPNAPLGTCPRCGAPVREGEKGFFCDNRACGFKLWRENRFFTSKRKTLDAVTAAALLKEGRVFMTGLYSERTGRTYDANVVMEDTGGKYVNFKLVFGEGGHGCSQARS